MKKADVINAITTKTGVAKREVETVVEAILDLITEELQKGGEVTFTGFGSFQVSNRAAREGINPLTKEKIHIQAVTVPKFRAGKALKDAVRK